MALKDLAEYTTKQGNVTAVWYDDKEETVVVQYEFLHISFLKPDFKAFVKTLVEAEKKLER